MSLTPYPDPLPRHRYLRPHSWKAWGGWLLLSLFLGGAWVGVCRLVQALMP